MRYPKDNEDLIGVVVSGGDDKPAKDHSGTCRVYVPSLHSNDVKLEDLPLIPRLGSGGNEGTTFFGGPPEDGCQVIIRRYNGVGSGFGYIVGVVKDDTNNWQSAPGNLNIRAHKLIQEALTRKHKINSKAKAGSGEAGSKPTEEAGGKYFHDLVKGIPNSSTLWPIAGMKIPQVNSIETAVQSFSAIMPVGAIAGLAGQALSMGNLFSNMPSVIKDKIFDALPNELGEALETMINVMPEITPSGLSGTRVNPEVFYANAAEMLTKCRDIDDLIKCITDLMTDTSLHGADTLPNITVEIDTPFGKANVEFDITGNGTESAASEVLDLVNKFSSLLTNTTGGFPGSFVDKNMWGGSSKVMGEMMSRLAPEEFKKATQMAQKSIAPGTKPRELVNQLQDLANRGKDVLEKIKKA